MSEEGRVVADDMLLKQDILVLETESPDLLIDLGVLAHIAFGTPKFTSGRIGVVNVPVHFLASRTRCAPHRVKSSLSRLEEWGMIEKVESPSSRMNTYRYNYSRLSFKEV